MFECAVMEGFFGLSPATPVTVLDGLGRGGPAPRNRNTGNPTEEIYSDLGEERGQETNSKGVSHDSVWPPAREKLEFWGGRGKGGKACPTVSVPHLFQEVASRSNGMTPSAPRDARGYPGCRGLT